MADETAGLREFLIEHVAEEMERRIRQSTPRGLFWPEEHARICKAAERVTRQQRRYAERQAAKRR